MADAVLRPHPYPYRASLAVTSDLDGCTAESFLAIHRFLNTTEDTPAGAGLGLDVADSFWFYSANPRTPGALAYFEGLTGTPGPHAGLIRDALARGWIDSLHTYGDFEFVGGFHRGLAERALAELKALGAPVRIWINHGGPFHNLQGVANPRRLGDVPELKDMNGQTAPTLEYHSDLMVEAGLRYVWASDLTEVVGQDRPCSRWEHYALPRPGVEAPRRLAALALGLLDGAEPVRKAVGYLGVPPYSGNDLIRPARLADGRPVYLLRRYGDFRRDGPEDIPDLLAPAVLDRLEASGGAMSFFTHLGKPRDGRTSPFLPREADCFRELARRHRQRRIRVVRTARLLQDAMLRRSLRFRVAGGDLLIEAVDDPVFGRYVPAAEDLAGSTFWTGAQRVLLDGRPLALDRNPPDGTGRASVTVRAG